MPKKNKKNNSADASLGRALIKARFTAEQRRRMAANNSMLHTAELQAERAGKVNVRSVTEESSIEEFLATASFDGAIHEQQRKDNISFAKPVQLLTKEETQRAKETHEALKDLLKIPRRPHWTPDMSRSQLDEIEKASFVEWRRSLVNLQKEYNILLTPYEKTLEFWRQLWRVVEKSDILVQIVDARNPLLFRCDDLEKYVKEVSSHKINMILINKADLLTATQRQHWKDYFRNAEVEVVFYSAANAAKAIDQQDKEDTVEFEKLRKDISNLQMSLEQNERELDGIINRINDFVDGDEVRKQIENLAIANETHIPEENVNHSDENIDILTREELINVFKTVHQGPKVQDGITTVGLVGYPNVGKSLTINSLLLVKKVSVSNTPGKTKHFQTLYLEKDLVLCDCPGLVMPSFVFTKAEMMLNGILSFNEMTDHVAPITLLAKLIPRHIIEEKYNITIWRPSIETEGDRPPTAEELLNAYAYKRDFMTSHGQPNNSRAARDIIKDYIDGKLLYCHAPPNVPQESYHTWPERQTIKERILTAREERAIRPVQDTDQYEDSYYSGSHTLGQQSSTFKTNSKYLGHRVKTRKQKTRRVYAHLDQH